MSGATARPTCFYRSNEKNRKEHKTRSKIYRVSTKKWSVRGIEGRHGQGGCKHHAFREKGSLGLIVQRQRENDWNINWKSPLTSNNVVGTHSFKRGEGAVKFA